MVASIDDPARLADTIVAHPASRSRTAESAGDREPGRTPRAFCHTFRDRNFEVRKTHAGQEADGEDPEGVLPTSRCVRSRRSSGRRTNSRTRSRSSRNASSRRRCRRSQGEGGKRAQEVEDDVADVRRGDRRSQLHRLAISLPWHEYTDDKLDIPEAERVLEEDHYGLEKVKQRTRVSRRSAAGRQMKGPILCLVGPPGVGKTSLGADRALHGPEIRWSPGGVRDEAEIRGHRRTYIGPPRQDHPVHEESGIGGTGLPSSTKWTRCRRTSRRSFVGITRGLDFEQNSSTNDHYLTSTTTFESDVHHDREHSREFRVPLQTAWRPSALRATRRSRSAHCEALPGEEAARGERPARSESRSIRQCPARNHPPLYEGSGCAESGTRDCSDLPRRRWRS